MTLHRLPAAALGLLLLAGSAAPTLAQIAPAPAVEAATSGRITAADRTRALAEIRRLVAERYVFPERREAIIDRLTRAERSGRYARDRAEDFVRAVTEDLSAASHDGHMYLLYDPAQYAVRSAPPQAGGAAGGDEDAYFTAMALRDNHGLTEMRILPGNVRYLKISLFLWVNDASGQAYDDAMRFLRGGDAVIIDLRGNGGGNAMAVNYLTSHFMAADRLLQTFYLAGEPPAQSRTLSHLPAGRLTGKPLYVLTDQGVGSAAEEFASHVKLFRLGELVGATTAGAANNNDLLPIAPGFVFSISTGRPVHSVSGGNWEGVGVAPDLDVAPRTALDVALARALRRLADAGGPDSSKHRWALAEAEARVKPPAVPAERQQALAGRYGPATVAWRDGALWLSRPDRPERRLAPLDEAGLYSLEGVTSARVRFTAEGLEILSERGSAQAFRRD